MLWVDQKARACEISATDMQGAGNTPAWDVHFDVGLLFSFKRVPHSVLFPPPSHKLHPLKVHMEITIRGVSCSILEAICPNCHLSISSHFIHLCHRDQRRSPYSPRCSGERAVSTSPAPALSIRLLLQDHDIINNFASPEDFFLSFSLPLCRRTSQRNVSQF